MVGNGKFIVTPKDEKSITITIRLYPELNKKLEKLSRQSNRSRNELINKALEFALNNLEFVDNNKLAVNEHINTQGPEFINEIQ